jgi:microcystin-dependent protein
MKLKIVVVDFEIPPHVKRWALRVGIPAVFVVGAGAFAYASVPTTWNTGDPLTAAALNGNFSALDERLAVVEASAPPPGTIVAYGGAEGSDGGVQQAPPGWLFCNGALVSRSTYANLFAAIAINFGGGDGISTFRLPDFRGQFLRGNDEGAGVDPGRTLGSTQSDAFASHMHGISDPGHAHGPAAGGFFFMSRESSSMGLSWGGNYAGFNEVGTTGAALTGITGTQDTGGTETRPKNVAVNYIIKY